MRWPARWLTTPADTAQVLSAVRHHQRRCDMSVVRCAARRTCRASCFGGDLYTKVAAWRSVRPDPEGFDRLLESIAARYDETLRVLVTKQWLGVEATQEDAPQGTVELTEQA